MDMQLNKDVLNTQRSSRAWSQTHLADASGLSLRTIQRIEKSGTASLESAKALAAVYEITIDTLKATDNKPQPTNDSLVKMSAKGKLLSGAFAVPLILVGLYLLWSEHQVMAWVDAVRDSIFSDTISDSRRDKISFLIVVIACGVPALVPGFIYDFVKQQGLFIQPKT